MSVTVTTGFVSIDVEISVNVVVLVTVDPGLVTVTPEIVTVWVVLSVDVVMSVTVEPGTVIVDPGTVTDVVETSVNVAVSVTVVAGKVTVWVEVMVVPPPGVMVTVVVCVVVAVTVTVEIELSVAVTVVPVRVTVSVVPGKLTVVVTVSVSVGPGAVVVTVTVTVDTGAVVGVVTGLLVVVDVVGVVSGGNVVGVLVVVVDVVDVLVHTGQVVIVDVEVTVIVAGALAIIAGDSGGFALFLKLYPGCVVIVEVLVSASKIGDDPGIVQYAEELVGNDTVGASDGNSAGDAEGSGTAEYATALGRLVAAYCILEGNDEGLLYTLNLATSFDITTSNLTALFGNMSKAGGIANNIAPTYRDGAMFANDNELYLYGGLLRLTDSQDPPAGNTVLGYERYQYGPDRGSWQPGFIIDDLDSGVTRYMTNGAGVSAPSENLGFYFSGMRGKDWGPIYADDESANITSDRMIKVDMSGMRDNKWSNLSLPAYVPARANAELVWIPVAEAGVLVAIGGVINPATIFSSDGLTSAQQNASKRASPGFMETVSVYDVSGDRWYLQNTTGDIPPQLTQFCSVYASAADGSSHNIYVYGGYDGLNTENTPSDDVYVLSLPSFSWIKLYSGNSTHGRSGHRCVKPYPDQMLVLGGVHLDPTHCLDGGVIQVFNLNTGRFQNTYSPTVWGEYKVPDLVTAVIGGGSKGGATKVSPTSWTNSSLADVLKTKYTKTISTWYPYNSTTSSSPTIAPVPDKGSRFPRWAGAIIGVILGLLLVAGAVIFWYLRRRRKVHESQSTSEQSARSWILRWMHSGGSTTGAPKSGDTTASTGYSAFANESNITPATAVSP
ncbi:hypothetical protein CNMCM6936_005031 [Aspergillus lentulus]|nr:hypothetical protein CNMCM6936_005031 [Aspergillus lentulus]